jgi:hypothetical protein
MRHVIVRPLPEAIPNFSVTPETTIAGCLVEALDLSPRACHPDGSPRFQRGQRVTVERIRFIEHESEVV